MQTAPKQFQLPLSIKKKPVIIGICSMTMNYSKSPNKTESLYDYASEYYDVHTEELVSSTQFQFFRISI